MTFLSLPSPDEAFFVKFKNPGDMEEPDEEAVEEKKVKREQDEDEGEGEEEEEEDSGEEDGGL